jgi:hypothetical protein
MFLMRNANSQHSLELADIYYSFSLFLATNPTTNFNTANVDFKPE